MDEPKRRWTDERVEQVLGKLLQVGVLVSALVVAAGGIVYVSRHRTEPADHGIFHGEPGDLRSPVGIVQDALSGSGRGIIQLGLLLLIATPVARVIFSVFAFARERDLQYVVLTLIVLAVLLYSLFIGQR
jgi:uncharacterized membrane protein